MHRETEQILFILSELSALQGGSVAPFLLQCSLIKQSKCVKSVTVMKLLHDCRSPKKINSISQAANIALGWSEMQEPFQQG